MKISTATARLIAAEQAKLTKATLPKCHLVDPSLRLVVVVAREGKCRPRAFLRYHAEPVGMSVRVDGFDTAFVAADCSC